MASMSCKEAGREHLPSGQRQVRCISTYLTYLVCFYHRVSLLPSLFPV
jgi:hypothetical protein